MNYNLAISIATDIIRKEESCAKIISGGRVQAYWDSRGKIWTIGWGNTYYQNGSAVKEGDIITQKQADELLKFIVAQKEKAIRPYVTATLNENQYAALISLTYNWGEGNVRKSVLLKLINAGASEAEIADQWDETAITAGGTYMKGLYNRRLNELKLFAQDVMDTVARNPELSFATGMTIMALAGYYIYRLAKRK